MRNAGSPLSNSSDSGSSGANEDVSAAIGKGGVNLCEISESEPK